MKKISLVFMLLLGSLVGRGQKTQMTFEIANADDRAFPYIVCGQQTIVAANSGDKGKRVASLDIEKPAYVTVYFSKLDSRLCYVEPGKSLVLRYTMPQGSKSLSYGGQLAKENSWLVSQRWAGPLPFSASRTIDQGIAAIDSLAAIDKANLKAQGFSKTFTEWETRRIETHALEQMLRIHTKDNATLKARLKNRVVKDGDWLRLPSYRHLADQYVRLLVRMDVGLKRTLEGEELADKRISCIEENISQADIKGYLVYITLFHLSEMNIPRYNDIYHRYVKAPQRLALYDASTRKAQKMAQGEPCPDFSFADNKGGKVSLADLKGKIVYIDLWATWCGPCKGEMPALLEMEKKFEGKGICFVSISVDSNKNIDLWKKSIDKMGLKGIQLHLGEQWDWLKTFMPSSISVPRFIILDREGRIVDAHAPRPSDKAAAEKLEALLAGGKQTAGITFFQGTYEDALAKAREEGKMVFMECYADWCGPCKNMAANVFTQAQVGDFFNSRFVSLKCNMEKDDYGKALCDRFDVVAYPKLPIITPDGFVAARHQGFAKAEKLIDLAQAALDNGGKSDEKLFDEGCRDDEFLKTYIGNLCYMHMADAVEKILDTLFDEKGIDQLRDKDYWEAYVKCGANQDSPPTKAFTDAYTTLANVHGHYAVAQKLRNIYASFAVVLSLYDVDGYRTKYNEAKVKAYIASLAECKLPDCKLLQQEVEYLVRLKNKNYKGAYEYGRKCLKRADARTLCNWAAWGERMVRDDDDTRKAMAEWAERAIANADGNTAIIEECNNVRHDLLASARPAITMKGKNSRTTIPMRGY